MLYSCTAILFILLAVLGRLRVFCVVLVVSGFFGGHLAPYLLRVLVMKISTWYKTADRRQCWYSPRIDITRPKNLSTPGWRCQSYQAISMDTYGVSVQRSGPWSLGGLEAPSGPSHRGPGPTQHMGSRSLLLLRQHRYYDDITPSSEKSYAFLRVISSVVLVAIILSFHVQDSTRTSTQGQAGKVRMPSTGVNMDAIGGLALISVSSNSASSSSRIHFAHGTSPTMPVSSLNPQHRRYVGLIIPPAPASNRAPSPDSRSPGSGSVIYCQELLSL